MISIASPGCCHWAKHPEMTRAEKQNIDSERTDILFLGDSKELEGLTLSI